MLLRTKGISRNIIEPLVGRVTRNPDKLDENTFLISENEFYEVSNKNFKGVLTKADLTESNFEFPIVSKTPTFEHLEEDDIVALEAFTKSLIETHNNQ